MALQFDVISVNQHFEEIFQWERSLLNAQLRVLIVRPNQSIAKVISNLALIMRIALITIPIEKKTGRAPTRGASRYSSAFTPRNSSLRNPLFRALRDAHGPGS